MADIENATWCGKRIADMTRKELLEVISQQEDELANARRAHGQTLDAWQCFREARANHWNV